MRRQHGIGSHAGKSKGAAKRRRATANKGCTPYTRAWPSGKPKAKKDLKPEGKHVKVDKRETNEEKKEKLGKS